MKYEIGFGISPQYADIPDANITGVLLPNEIQTCFRGEEAVLRALATPIGSGRLRDIVLPSDKVVIITSDVTRPLPSYKIIPHILNELFEADVRKENITVVFALGSHRKHTEAEKRKLVGEAVYNTVKCVDGDTSDVVHMGTTSSGTPVDIVRVVAEADKRIGVGNIEYHYFAGYSGGAKAIMPGVSTRSAIQANHSKMVLPEAAAGKIEGNPVRMDIEEAINFCSLDFILNVVLDEHKEIIYATAGHFIKAHRDGCAFLDKLYMKEIDGRADIVIASQGGYPKDLNLYQTQKALDNAKHAVADGGIIILTGSCKEGLGEEVFEDWMKNSPSPSSMVERIKKDFQLGGHKAAAIALVLEKADVYLVSEMDEAFVRSIFLKPFRTVNDALSSAFEKLGKEASVLIMPYAGSTLPKVKLT